MRVLLTGATGFIGKYLWKYLKENTSNKIYGLSRRANSEDMIPCDYSIEELTEIFASLQIEVIIHLAAVRGKNNGIRQFQENEILTENILLAMKHSCVKHIIFMSSIAVYSDTTKIPWKENQVIAPKTCYGITKAACEYLIQLYAKDEVYSYTILRIAQVLGLEETHAGMMNIFLNQAYKKDEIKVIGKSEAKREFVYIEDIAASVEKIINGYSAYSGVYNLGSMEAYTNLEIAQMINSVFENSKLTYQNNIPENIESSLMDSTKLYHSMEYQPTSLKTAFKKICAEMRAKDDL